MRKTASSDAGEAWVLLVDLLLAERGRIPAVAADLDLSPVQCHALRLLEPGRPTSMRELARALACDASYVTGIVDRLEARGFIERRSARDRRLRIVAVTRRGAAARARVLARLATPPEPIARLTRVEQRTLCALLRRALAPSSRA